MKQYKFISSQETFDLLTQLQDDAENLAASRLDDLCQVEVPSGASSKSSLTLSVDIQCSHHHELNGPLNCESTNFTSLIFDRCNIGVNYTYSITNKNNESVRVLHLIDESFDNIVDQSQIIEPNTEVSFLVGDEINICEDLYITKQVVAIGEISNDDVNNFDDDILSLAHGSLIFKSP